MPSPRYVTTESNNITELRAAMSCKKRRSFGLSELWKSSKIPEAKARIMGMRSFGPRGKKRSKNRATIIPMPPALGVEYI